ncbi:MULTISPECIES: DUF2971 domain-containing protein [unclassified Pseudomonas]|uniref:DUF2971 domain-containing protein n=1 Tax=unclassified Pseudomonas TaxID=196821 RepID=UPI0008381350|nr:MULTISPECIES: DUF2971 domain-containing protein [unclassified Pseudomonas]QIH09014.1 DUF2971 domain-containing protein [Pseudomonas sp. BIOMIG1BAC]
MDENGVARVYHFCSTKYGLENIRNRRLKIATIMELNDPFELLAYDLNKQELRRVAKELKVTFADKFGLICFSRSFRSPVQWAHYGDKHKGICLGFDIDKEALHKISYTSARKRIENDNLSKDNAYNWFLEFLTTKHRSWSYEKEERLMKRLDTCERAGVLYFSKFCEAMKLQQVIVGCESNVSGAELRDALGEELREVSIFKVRPAFSKFEMVRNKSIAL